MYLNVTEMDATIESDTSQNTNSLISSGYFIENYVYSQDDGDKENNSTNNIISILCMQFCSSFTRFDIISGDCDQLFRKKL